jgi:hypothetical protein
MRAGARQGWWVIRLATAPYRSTAKFDVLGSPGETSSRWSNRVITFQVVEPTLVSTTADGTVAAALFGDVFLVGAFVAVAFRAAFTATFLTRVFALTAFLVAGFFATAFFAVTFLAVVFPPAGFALPVSSVLTLAPSTRNLVRSFTAASHAGAGPRPLHAAPVFGSRYFAGWGPLRCPLEASASAATEVFLAAALALLAGFTLAERTASVPLATRNLVRSLASAIHAGARPCPVQVAPVLGC